MGIRVWAGFAMTALVAMPAAAQKRGDQATLVFTVSGAYLQGTGLWAIPAQPVTDPPLSDVFVLSRSIKSTLAASASGTYYPGRNIGITVEGFLMGLGFDDSCRLASPAQSLTSSEVCADIDRVELSAAAVALSTGAVFRFASREVISPFARVSVGALFTNQSSVVTEGASQSNGGAFLRVYDDESRNRVRPAFALGVGTTFAINKGYYIRWEVRDNYVGLVKVTGPTTNARSIPPHETVYKHLLSVHIGFDVVLERERGRRY